MNVYLQIIKGTWAEYMVYRLNFVMWRVRMVMQLLITYFLWSAISGTNTEFFGYTQSMILTYILLSSIVRTLVLSTTTMGIGDLINQGNLSNYLIRPIHFFSYYAAKDVADKALNLFFAIGEFTILYFILRPPVFLQMDPFYLMSAMVAILIGMVLYFYFSLMLGFLGFWTPDVWGPRFISFVIIEFFAGGLFPLDILPKAIYNLTQFLPFSYFIYFPLKVYTGQLTGVQVFEGLGIGLLWTVGLWYIALQLWHKGLKAYTAEGK